MKVDNRNIYLTKTGIKLYLDETRYLDKSIIDYGYFEPKSTELVKRIIKNDWVILDIGANIGYYTTLFSDLVGDHGKVYAFEPTLHYLEALRANVAVNNSSNVEIINTGLSDMESKSKIKIGDSSATMHWISEAKERDTEIIELQTLDSFIEKRSISRLDFIKIDIDGHEPRVFKGASKTLEKFRPVILFEISKKHYEHAGFSLTETYNEIIPSGYNCFTEDLDPIRNLNDFLEYTDHDDKSVNLLLSIEEKI